ncbi:hypothetical protein C2E23DRAFT_827965 [Lenzites betulinus]|nr:hypothetical protein C2E23DRAFT_827965 [Lenzites betulinus]
MRIALRGTCGGVAAAIVIDSTLQTSTVSTSFALSHGLPRTVQHDENARIKITTQGPIDTPTPSGWLTCSLPMRIGFVRMYDVVLGQDWVDLCHP